jgi:hypothetical protein
MGRREYLHMRRAALTLLLLASHSVAGQVVRGRVVAPDSVGIAGAIVTLLDSAGTPLARALADDSGRFSMRPSAPGRYGLHVMRIGHASVIEPNVRLTAGTIHERTIIHTGAQISLAASAATSEPRCVRRDSASMGLRVWDEVQKALVAAQLTRLTRAYTMDAEMYVTRQSANRMQPPTTRRSEMKAARLRALTPVPPEQLARDGYVARSSEGDRYFPPDDVVLLSESFASTHCLRLLPGDAGSDVVRLAFLPLPDRTQPEIRGVISLDRATSELRRVEFAYTNLPPAEYVGEAGGEITYRRLPEGSWIVESWSLSLPTLEQYVRQQPVPAVTNRRGQTSATLPAVTAMGAAWTISGGGVTRILFGDTTVWAAQTPPEPRGPVTVPRMSW